MATQTRAELATASFTGVGPETGHMSPDKLKMRRTLMDSYNASVTAAPKIGFGTAARPALLEGDIESPGPGAYQIKSTMFTQSNSLIRSPPCFSMRSREKFGSPDLKAIDRAAQLEPGPGHYKPKQVSINEREAPKYSFPRDPGPDAREKSHRAPGPGHYKVPPAVGKQVLSTKRSHNGVGFGSGNRPPLIMISTADVGPGEYRVTNGSTGEKQIDSRFRNDGGIKFGHATRSKSVDGGRAELEPAPGPGSYKLPPGICGRGAAMPYKTAPAARLSGREKFGSPF